MVATREYLAKKHNNACFLEIHECDLATAFYDWKFNAIGILRDLVEEEHCNIVIHSNWRVYQTFEKLKALFQIYDLEDSIIGVTDNGDKTASIKKYLSTNKPELSEVILLERDWKCINRTLDKLSIYKESNQVYYLPTQRDVSFWSLNLKDSWGEIEKALNMLI